MAVSSATAPVTAPLIASDPVVLGILVTILALVMACLLYTSPSPRDS